MKELITTEDMHQTMRAISGGPFWHRELAAHLNTIAQARADKRVAAGETLMESTKVMLEDPAYRMDCGCSRGLSVPCRKCRNEKAVIHALAACEEAAS